MLESFGEDNCRGKYWSCQATPSRFITSGFDQFVLVKSTQHERFFLIPHFFRLQVAGGRWQVAAHFN
jgi:hypothetical protein